MSSELSNITPARNKQTKSGRCQSETVKPNRSSLEFLIQGKHLSELSGRPCSFTPSIHGIVLHNHKLPQGSVSKGSSLKRSVNQVKQETLIKNQTLRGNIIKWAYFAFIFLNSKQVIKRSSIPIYLTYRKE